MSMTSKEHVFSYVKSVNFSIKSYAEDSNIVLEAPDAACS